MGNIIYKSLKESGRVTYEKPITGFNINDTPYVKEYDNLDELIKGEVLPKMESWGQEDWVITCGGGYSEKKDTIMISNPNAEEWWVIGFVWKNLSDYLPKYNEVYKGPKKQRDYSGWGNSKELTTKQKQSLQSIEDEINNQIAKVLAEGQINE